MNGGLTIDWQVNASSGWGLYGLHLVLETLRRGGGAPLLLQAPSLEGVLPHVVHRMAPVFERYEVFRREGSTGPVLDGTLLRAAANNFAMGRLELRGHKNVATTFFEDITFDRAQIELARAFDKIIVGSSWNRDVLQGLGLSNVELVLQGIDQTIFHPAPASGTFKDRFVIFSGGKLEYRKGQDILIAAFREFRKRHSDALLMFAWYNHWPETMDEIPLRGHVVSVPCIGAGGPDFLGWLEQNGVPSSSALELGLLPNAVMGQCLREADVAVFPNRCEGGTNLVAMEAIGCGVPTIVSANSGHLDLISRGCVIPLSRQRPTLRSKRYGSMEGWGESDVDEILATLEALYSDAAVRRELGRRGAATISELSWSNQMGQLVRHL